MAHYYRSQVRHIQGTESSILRFSDVVVGTEILWKPPDSRLDMARMDESQP